MGQIGLHSIFAILYYYLLFANVHGEIPIPIFGANCMNFQSLLIMSHKKMLRLRLLTNCEHVVHYFLDTCLSSIHS
jgi:hypothetical protein